MGANDVVQESVGEMPRNGVIAVRASLDTYPAVMTKRQLCVRFFKGNAKPSITHTRDPTSPTDCRSFLGHYVLSRTTCETPSGRRPPRCRPWSSATFSRACRSPRPTPRASHALRRSTYPAVRVHWEGKQKRGTEKTPTTGPDGKGTRTRTPSEPRSLTGPGAPTTRWGREVSHTNRLARAYAQWIVMTRLLYHLHDPASQFSRMQRIYPRPW